MEVIHQRYRTAYRIAQIGPALRVLVDGVSLQMLSRIVRRDGRKLGEQSLAAGTNAIPWERALRVEPIVNRGCLHFMRTIFILGVIALGFSALIPFVPRYSFPMIAACIIEIGSSFQSGTKRKMKRRYKKVASLQLKLP
jgi:hypothetical protein